MTEQELANIIIQHHKKVFGWVTKDHEPRCGYFVTGFVIDALKQAGKLEQTKQEQK